MIIFDLDNCLADDEWRRSMIPEPGQRNSAVAWDAYHRHAIFDDPRNHYFWRDHSLIFTARPEAYRALTLEWLDKHGFRIRPEDLCMRGNDDFRPSVEVKRDMLAHSPYRAQITTAYDDLEHIVAMYREHGITAQRLAIDDEGGCTA